MPNPARNAVASSGAVPPLNGRARRRSAPFAIVAVLAMWLLSSSAAPTVASFSATTSNGASSQSAKRVFSGERSLASWQVSDAADGSVSSATDSTALSDAVKWRTGVFSTAYASNRYVEFTMNDPLPAGLSISSGVTANIQLASAASGSNACYYLEVRRASTDAVLGTFGSSGSPVACSTGSTQVLTQTDISSVVTTTDIANDLKLRLYGIETASKAWDIDMATTSAPVYGKSITLFPKSRTDSSTGTATTTPWSIATVDATAYVTAGNWSNNFAASRYVEFTYSETVPNAVAITAVNFDYTYKSNTSGDTTDWYMEVYASGSLIGTHGSTTAPQGSNATSSFVTDTVSLTEVDTGTELNALKIRVYSRVTGSRKSQTDKAAIRATYSLAAAGCVDPRTDTISATADSWIQQDGASANSNFGTDTLLDVKSQNTKVRRALMQFGTLPTVGSGCTFTSATLRTYIGSFGGARTYNANQISASWGELTVTYNNQPGITGSAATASITATGWVTFDVTSIVQAMYTAGTSYGFMIRDSDESTATNVANSIQSRENGSGNAPQLLITSA